MGQLTIQSAWLLGAGRVLAIDNVPERLGMAQEHGHAEVINFDQEDVYDSLMVLTGGRGPDRCIDVVGCEAHASSHLIAAIGREPRDRPPVRTARGHTLLPQGRYAVRFRCLHRTGQHSLWRGDEQGPDLEDGADYRYGTPHSSCDGTVRCMEFQNRWPTQTFVISYSNDPIVEGSDEWAKPR